ncbi:MAG: enoyl-CoA hydratase-related protein [Bryobacteraceae bacterium]
MSYEQILYDVTDWVATITLNRPDKLNAWTRQMEQEVQSAVEAAAADDAVRAIVLTGSGKGFCAGADMSILAGLTEEGGTDGAGSQMQPNDVGPANAAAGSQKFRRKHAWLTEIPKPVIAAVHGPAVGLGFVLPLFCDFRLAAASARFSTIFAKRGLVAEYGLAWMLPRIIGLAPALDMLMTARMVDATEALHLGLVNRVLPEDGFLAAAQSFAREIAVSVSPRSIGIMKKQVYLAQMQDFQAAYDTSLEEMIAGFSSEDFKEGVAHFVEKRAPRFSGK